MTYAKNLDGNLAAELQHDASDADYAAAVELFGEDAREVILQDALSDADAIRDVLVERSDLTLQRAAELAHAGDYAALGKLLAPALAEYVRERITDDTLIETAAMGIFEESRR